MGNIFKKEKKIKIFTDSLDIEDLKQLILKSGVYLDCDFLFFIDVTKSNLFMDGTNRHHSFSNNKCSKHVISNPYLSILDIIKDFPFDDKSKFNLYFFGSYKAENSSDKLEKICVSCDNNTKELFKKESNVYNNVEELIEAYINGIKIIINKDMHPYWGTNFFYKGVPMINILSESINQTKLTKKFTTAIIMLDGINNNYSKKDIYAILEKIVEASNYPIEFICICIGKEDFKLLEGLDDFNYKNIGISYKKLCNLEKKRKYDNFQNVILNKIIRRNLINKNIRDEIFKNIFMELPQVYEYIKRKDVINYAPKKNTSKHNSKNMDNKNNSLKDIKGSVLEINLNDTNDQELKINKNKRIRDSLEFKKSKTVL